MDIQFLSLREIHYNTFCGAEAIEFIENTEKEDFMRKEYYIQRIGIKSKETAFLVANQENGFFEIEWSTTSVYATKYSTYAEAKSIINLMGASSGEFTLIIVDRIVKL